MKATRNVGQVLSELRHYFNLERIFVYRPRNQYDKAPLTEQGQHVIGEAVGICLQHNVIPKCSVSGEDVQCDSRIFSINQIEIDDLVEKLERICHSK